MIKTLRLPASFLIMLALSAPVAQAVADEVITVEIGEVGQPAQDFSWTVSGGSRVDLKFADNKYLSDGPGMLVFELASGSPRSYSGFLQDAAGNKILGTDFSGTSNLVPTNIDLDSETVWAGMRFDVGGGTTMPPFTLSWITRPTVGQPEGNQAPTANAGGPYTAGADVDIQFDGSGSSDPDGEITSYRWFFGDGNEGTGEKPVHRYDLAGRYTVLLTVTDDAGARASAFGTVDIGTEDEPPNAIIRGGLEGYTGTVNVPIQFDGSPSRDDVGIESYRWQWQDGAGGRDGSGPMPQHAYPFIGEFTTILNVTDTSGQTDGDYTVTTVAGGNQPPVADAGPPVSGAVGVPVTFDASGSNDPEGEITQYAWDFGDETDIVTDAGPTPTHTYAEPGTYTVTVIVTDPDDPSVSDSDFTTADITGGNQLPTAEANGPYTGSVGVPVQFQATGSSDPDGSIQDYFWIFDDGNTGEGATASHTYTEGGNYQATLIVTDNDGASSADYATVSIDSDNQPPRAVAGGPYPGVPGAPVTFDGTDSFDPDGEIVNYSWDFGDSGSGSGPQPQPTHTYAVPGVYYVVLTTVDDDGVTAQDLTLAVIGRLGSNIPPKADAGGLYRGTAGVPLSFDGSASSDEDGIETYEWKFGDEGSSSFGEQVDHTYATSGFYHVTLTVKDTQGLTSSDGTIAIIGSDSEPPIADAGGTYNGTVGNPVQFDGSESTDDTGIDSYTWDFGDGDAPAGSGVSPQYTYTADGQYNVQLTVEDTDGNTSVDSALVTIGQGNLPPEAHARGPYIGVPGVPVTFDGTSSSDPDGEIVSYDWTFGDGNFGTGAKPRHTYMDEGSYNVTLEVSDEDGTFDSHTTVTVIGELEQPRRFVNLDQVFGSPNVATLLFNSNTGTFFVRVKDIASGASIVDIDIGSGFPIDIAAVPDVNGNNTEVAVLIRSMDADNVKLYDGGTGELLRNLSYAPAYTPQSMAVIDDIDGLGTPAIAVLGVDASGNVRAQIKDAATGAQVRNVQFAPGFPPEFMIAVPNVAGSPTNRPELAVLGIDDEGNIRVQLKDAGDGSLITWIQYAKAFIPHAMVGVDAPSGPAIGVLGEHADGRISAQVKDAATRQQIHPNRISFSNNYAFSGMVAVGDLNGNGTSELAYLGVDANGNVRAQIKDAATRAQIGLISFAATFPPDDFEAFGDVNGNDIMELGVLGTNPNNGNTRAQFKDADTGQEVNVIFVP